MSAPDPAFERWWKDEGKKFSTYLADKEVASIAWSNGAYLARNGEQPIDFRRMKKAPPDQPGLWAYRIPGAGTSINVAATRGDSGTLHLHHPNGSVYTAWRWSELYPETRWRKIA